ncbi:hypothetical protein [Bacillus solimangrovi]|uniref:Uncharacterized protein n=1 Tax=Bacillus solimangrovi TaxID=1305675 RepID=A0A1E5LF45_9BACI|nr:hypothetical protein [Bacillus solimangrovi]OEH92708.1 hypothetical protein BFG57_01505 [Bacillus solimangrovi]
MNFLVNGIEYLFSRKRTLVYTSLHLDNYYKIKGKLLSSNVKFRVASDVSLAQRESFTHNNYGVEYKFYVAKEDEHRALEAIHHK